MDDLISRSALKEWLTRPTGFRANCEDCTDIDCLDCIIGEAIDNAPAVDAEKVCEQMGLVKEAMDMAKAYLRPVRHGRWIISSDGYYPYCWDCKARPKGGNMTKYCPNCGAKMDGDFE